MDLLRLRLRIEKEADIEKLRNSAQLIIKCMVNDRTGGGYCVVNDDNPPHSLYNGSRENCTAFIEGYEAAPSRTSGALTVL